MLKHSDRKQLGEERVYLILYSQVTVHYWEKLRLDLTVGLLTAPYHIASDQVTHSQPRKHTRSLQDTARYLGHSHAHLTSFLI